MRIRGEVEEGIAVRPQRKKFPLLKDEGGPSPLPQKAWYSCWVAQPDPRTAPCLTLAWTQGASPPSHSQPCTPVSLHVSEVWGPVVGGGRLEAWPSSCGPTYGLQVNPTYSLCLRS